MSTSPEPVQAMNAEAPKPARHQLTQADVDNINDASSALRNLPKDALVETIVNQGITIATFNRDAELQALMARNNELGAALTAMLLPWRDYDTDMLDAARNVGSMTDWMHDAIIGARAAIAAMSPAALPQEPTEAMLIAARDWSYKKYGKPIGNEAAIGCWQAMHSASGVPPATLADVPAEERDEVSVILREKLGRLGPARREKLLRSFLARLSAGAAGGEG